MKKILIYDTTLRDGSQGENISFSLEDKLHIARKLDELGVDYIEGGWPGSNAKDVAFFQRAQGAETEACQTRGVRQHLPPAPQCGPRPEFASLDRSRYAGGDDIREDLGPPRKSGLGCIARRKIST